MNPAPSRPSLEDGLRQTLVDLVAIPSVSFQEHDLANHVAARLGRRSDGELTRLGDELAFRFPACEGRPRVVLCGHLDTVPPRDNLEPRVEGDRIYGLGTTDLKAGLAVFLELIERCDPAEFDVDPLFVFYTCEEVAYHESGLPTLKEQSSLLDEVRFAVCVEPTANAVELGCLGTLHASVTVHGKAAHSARPWFGENAIHVAAPLIERLAAIPVRDLHSEGPYPVTYREVVSATTIEGGSARNVIPDRCRVNFNFRFAPDRSLADAQDWIRRQIGPEHELEFLDLSPAGRVCADNPLCRRLIETSHLEPRAKQAWTDVGRFSEWGIDAVSCGPGIPEQAHQKGEYATLSGMVESARLFQDFLRNQP